MYDEFSLSKNKLDLECHENFQEIRFQLDMHREKLKEKIDKISNKMINKLENYQQECYDNIDKIKIEEKTKDLIKEIESDLDV